MMLDRRARSTRPRRIGSGFVNQMYADRAALDVGLSTTTRPAFARISPHAIRLGRRAFSLLADLPAGQALDAAPFLNLPFFLGDRPRGGRGGVPRAAAAAHGRPTPTDHRVNSEAYIVAAVRTPVGRRGGGLRGVHPADLARACVCAALLDRAGVDGEHVDDVILGCVSQVGAQASNIARTVALSAGLPESVPGFTLDRQCGSSQQAVHLAAQAVRVGEPRTSCVAGGVEVMSRVPIASPTTVGEEAGLGHPRHGERLPRAVRRPGDHPVPRRRTDRRAVGPRRGPRWRSSRWRAIGGRWPRSDGGRVRRRDRAGRRRRPRTRDRGADTTLEKHGVAGAAAPRRSADRRPRQPDLRRRRGDPGRVRRCAYGGTGCSRLARVHAMAVVGSDPVLMLTGPIPATEQVLKSAELTPGRHRRRTRSTRRSRRSCSPGRQETGADLGAHQPARRRDRARAIRSARPVRD